MMDIPRATYRLQFSGTFRFRDAEALAPYLAGLGISHVYASPIFKARKGSAHGYDIVDPNEINPELGTPDEFEALVRTLKRHGIGWIQDIVPNHMAWDSENGMLMDVLEIGQRSLFYRAFDIDWETPCEDLRYRVLAPFLDRPYADCLEGGEMRVGLGENGFALTWRDRRFPLRPDGYAQILGPALQGLMERARGGEPGVSDWHPLLKILLDGGSLGEGDLHRLKRSLWKGYTLDADIRRLVDGRLDELNGRPGNPESFDLLDDILANQHYRLSDWRAAAERINYRRFFDINELIGVRVEDDDVLRFTHRFVGRLVEHGCAAGLRVDHVDGLYDPTGYLETLRRSAPDTYVIVEKILGRDELLPRSWPLQGTTGYEFLNAMNGLFVKGENADRLERLFRDFTGTRTPYRELLNGSKRQVLYGAFRGDLDRLSRLALRTARGSRRWRDLSGRRLRAALREILAAFPVYRTYRSATEIRGEDALYIGQALREARAALSGHDAEIAFAGMLLEPGEEHLPESLLCRMRFQQFCTPLMAKGFEDTLLYVYNRLISLNEVGGDPERFGVPVADFHRFCSDRQRLWPHGLNATATHDTKRGEDARARLNVLSEFPGTWTKSVRQWSRINRRKKTLIGGSPAPDHGDEYLLYQSLVGAFPLEGNTQEFRDRMKIYVVKALREAKRRSSWAAPDNAYEGACLRFLDAILDARGDNRFLDGFLRFHAGIAWFGMLNSLSQILIKCAAPGVPDFYRGTESWDFSLVDPDNRRPVDFEKLRGLQEEIRRRFDTQRHSLLQDLLDCPEDGRIKWFLTWRALSARQAMEELFRDGEYLPLDATGRNRKNVIAFARRRGMAWALAVAPRLSASMLKKCSLPLGPAVWQDTVIEPLQDMPSCWRDAVTGDEQRFEGTCPVGEILRQFPASLLIGVRECDDSGVRAPE